MVAEYFRPSKTQQTSHIAVLYKYITTIKKPTP